MWHVCGQWVFRVKILGYIQKLINEKWIWRAPTQNLPRGPHCVCYAPVLRVKKTCKNDSYNYHNWSLFLDHTDGATPLDTTIRRVDIGHFVQRVGIDDSTLFEVVKNVWSPTPDYKFPSHNGRPFHFNWLKRFTWLVTLRSTVVLSVDLACYFAITSPSSIATNFRTYL